MQSLSYKKMKEALSKFDVEAYHSKCLNIATKWLSKYSFIENSELARKYMNAMSSEYDYGYYFLIDNSRVAEILDKLKAYTGYLDFIDLKSRDVINPNGKIPSDKKLAIWLNYWIDPYCYARMDKEPASKMTPEDLSGYMVGSKNVGVDPYYEIYLPDSLDSEAKQAQAYNKILSEAETDLAHADTSKLKKLLIIFAELVKEGLLTLHKA